MPKKPKPDIYQLLRESKTRQFQGERFVRGEASKKKDAARKIAKQRRKKGFKARVVKEHGYYFVYIKRKRK